MLSVPRPLIHIWTHKYIRNAPAAAHIRDTYKAPRCCLCNFFCNHFTILSFLYKESPVAFYLYSPKVFSWQYIYKIYYFERRNYDNYILNLKKHLIQPPLNHIIFYKILFFYTKYKVLHIVVFLSVNKQKCL